MESRSSAVKMRTIAYQPVVEVSGHNAYNKLQVSHTHQFLSLSLSFLNPPLAISVLSGNKPDTPSDAYSIDITLHIHI